MTPADVKAIRILAEHFGLDGVGYNPRKKELQANKLVEHFGLTVKLEQKGHGRSTWRGYIAYKGDKEVAAMGGYGTDADHRRYAIVHGAAELVKPGWYDNFRCFEEGLGPFDIGHILDARR